MKVMKRFLLILVFLSTIFCTIGCMNQSELKKAVASLKIPKEVTSSLNLPSSDEENGITYHWESSHPEILSNDGTVYAQEVDCQVELILQATNAKESIQKTFHLTIKATDLTPFIRAWDYYRPKIDDTLYRDVKFYTQKYGEVEVEYRSLHPDIISDDGKITRLIVDQKATIQVILRYHGLEKIFTKELTVAKLSDQTVIAMVDEWLPTIVQAFQNGEIRDLPTTHPLYGTRVRWTTTHPDIYIMNGMVKKVDVPTSFGLYAEIILGSLAKGEYFTIENFTGGVSESELLDAWLPTLLPDQIFGTKNYVKSDDHLDYQVRTPYGGVLNQINGQIPEIIHDFVGTTDESYVGRVSSGTRPSVSESTLASKFYSGYQMPNNLNILWIVVHETGMPKDGNDAALLSTHMHKKMINNTSNSSWHFTVDDKSIYHHIPLHLSAWHASDGSTIGGGNKNGIGIEMCINQDGNFEAAMRNDAKLIAYLMHEYNLTLANVRRHYDFAPDKKVCPNYMIQTNRWHEFLDLVYQEYLAMAFLKDATVSWTVEGLEYFKPGLNNMLINLPVQSPTQITITLDVNKDSYHFNQSKTILIGALND